jgi:hypothetical protein
LIERVARCESSEWRIEVDVALTEVERDEAAALVRHAELTSREVVLDFRNVLASHSIEIIEHVCLVLSAA